MQSTDEYIRSLLRMCGYYKIKHSLRMYILLKQLQKEDAEIRRKISIAIPYLKEGLLNGDNDVVVSLTSYGKRITNSLPYTLYSLLIQEVLPSKIVVFLDKDEICPESLPQELHHMEKCGVEFYYVENLRSYKKLIPALKLFPEQPILTVDDDMYYATNFVKVFLDAYLVSDKKTVLGTVGRWVTRDQDGQLLPYLSWRNLEEGDPKRDQVSFFGCGGCFYPPHIFDAEILKEDIFMKLAPSADDIWFWVMEYRAGIATQLIITDDKLYTPIDRTTWFDRKRSDCLTTHNDVGGLNNKQFKALQDYYGFV